MKNWRQFLYWVGILVGGGLFVFQFATVINQFRVTPITFKAPNFVGLAFIFIVLAITTQILTWITLIKSFGVDLSLKELYCAYVLPFLARYLPGSVWGYIGRSFWLKQQHQIPESLTHASTILELVSLIASASIVLLINMLLVAKDDSVIILLVILVISPLFFVGLVWFLLERAIKLKLFSPKSLTSVFCGLVVSLGLHCVLWLLHGLGLYFLLNAFFEMPINAFSEIVRFFIMSWLAGFIVPFIPAGLGVRDLALSNLLTGLEISYYVSSIIALLSRLIILVSELFFVVIAFFLLKNNQHNVRNL